MKKCGIKSIEYKFGGMFIIFECNEVTYSIIVNKNLINAIELINKINKHLKDCKGVNDEKNNK